MWIWVVLLALGTFVIAAASIGSVTGTLATRPRRSVYDLAEATHFVADRRPEDMTARLSYDDVESVLGAHCDFLADQGLASSATADTVRDDLVVVADEEVIGWILGRLGDTGTDLADEDVVEVLEVEQDYYRAIGMFGPRVDPDSGDPDSSDPDSSDPDSGDPDSGDPVARS